MAGSIEQIAKLAGTSRGTVDRVLNNRGRVSPETEQLVRRAAATLGYVPKHARAKAIQEGAENTVVVSPVENVSYGFKIGIVTMLCKASFMLKIHEGIADESLKLANQGIEVILRESPTVSESEQLAALEELEALGVDGVCVMPVESERIRAKINELVREKHIPVVTFNADIVGTDRMCFVGLDNRKSGRVAAGLLGMLLGGQGKVLAVTGNFANSTSTSRIAGFDEELKASFPEVELVGVQSSMDRADEVESIITHTLAIYPDLKGIIVVSGGQEGIARAFEKVCPDHKVHVLLYDLTPKNCGLLHTGTADFLIDQDGYTQGYRALSYMADWLRWGKLPEKELMYTNIDIKTRWNI